MQDAAADVHSCCSVAATGALLVGCISILLIPLPDKSPVCRQIETLERQHWATEQKSNAAQGLECTTLFCGDGINDLAALSAANVGMAIGATDAAVTASVTTPHASVAGMHHRSHILIT